MASKTYRVNDFVESALNLSLPSCVKNANGGHTMNDGDWKLLVPRVE
jgi:hypothetical protein